MENGKRVFLILLGVFVFTAAAHADMMPVPQESAVYRQSHVCYSLTDHQCEYSSDIYYYTYVTGQDLWSVGFLSEVDVESRQNSEIQMHFLTDGPNSLEFCLSALISLGLCCFAHWVKRHSLDFVPKWQHEGGPFQIGHSHSLMPGTLRPTTACCFIQPFRSEYSHLPQYYLKTIVSIWRKSQFTLAVIASRGPPLRT